MRPGAVDFCVGGIRIVFVFVVGLSSLWPFRCRVEDCYWAEALVACITFAAWQLVFVTIRWRVGAKACCVLNVMSVKKVLLMILLELLNAKIVQKATIKMKKEKHFA